MYTVKEAESIIQHSCRFFPALDVSTRSRPAQSTAHLASPMLSRLLRNVQLPGESRNELDAIGPITRGVL